MNTQPRGKTVLSFLLPALVSALVPAHALAEARACDGAAGREARVPHPEIVVEGPAEGTLDGYLMMHWMGTRASGVPTFGPAAARGPVTSAGPVPATRPGS